MNPFLHLLMTLIASMVAGGFLYLLCVALAQMKRERDRRVSEAWLDAQAREEASRGLEEGPTRREREPVPESSPSATDAYKRPWVH